MGTEGGACPIAMRPGLTVASRRHVRKSLVGYIVLFAVLMLPWERVATHAAPAGYIGASADQWLVVWILAWVAHAIATDPLHVFDANINFPAPAQLASIEHFFSTQILFAPTFALTGNAVLTANVVLMATYPLAALAMERLLLALGCTAPAAWVSGLAFALGAGRVPGNFMALKFLNLYLPLVCLGLTRLRERPALDRALALAGTTVLAMLSSYYLAVMASMTAAIWAVFELVEPSPGRKRFAVLGTAAMLAAFVVLLYVSTPYFARPEASSAPLAVDPAIFDRFARLNARVHLSGIGVVPVALATFGLATIRSRTAAVRSLATRGVVLTAVAFLFMLGPAQHVAGRTILLPYALFLDSPLRFFRAAEHFVVIAGFGVALLAGAALDAAGRRAGRSRAAAAVVAALALVVTRGWALTGPRFEEFSAQWNPVYDLVRTVSRAEDVGPLLELPTLRDVPAPPSMPQGTEVEAMLGSTRHWLPLVSGCSPCYTPPHYPVLAEAASRLPDREAFGDIVDLTHARWLLLRPDADWLGAWAGKRAAMVALPCVHPIETLHGWDLLRIDCTPMHLEWFATIAAGPRPGQSPLGTRFAPVPDDGARSAVSACVSPLVVAGRPLSIPVTVENLGPRPWPVVVGRKAATTYSVHLVASWWPANAARDPVHAILSEDVSLRRDVPPYERLTQDVTLVAPRTVGLHEVEIRVRQYGGPSFDSTDNVPFRARITVLAPR